MMSMKSCVVVVVLLLGKIGTRSKSISLGDSYEGREIEEEVARYTRGERNGWVLF